MTATPAPRSVFGGFQGYVIGDTTYLISPIQFLTQAYADTPQKITLKNFVPKNATSFRVKCSLYRGVANFQGITDVTGCCQLPPFVGIYNFDVWAGAYISGLVDALQPGTLVECVGNTIEIPNITENADWAVFYWLHSGTTLVGAEITLQLVSYKVPSFTWPPRPLKNSVLR